jgi:hypothetical protein
MYRASLTSNAERLGMPRHAPGRTRGLIRTRSISTPAGAKIPTVVAIRFACFTLAVAGTFATVRIAFDG